MGNDRSRYCGRLVDCGFMELGASSSASERGPGRWGGLQPAAHRERDGEDGGVAGAARFSTTGSIGSTTRDPEARLREFVLYLFVAGAAASAIDLVVLGHFKDLKQWVPLVLLPASLLVAAWHRFRPGCPGMRAFQVTMALLVASGLVGVWFHCSSNVAFELEMYPSMAGWEPMRETLSGATPALAPAVMAQQGLLGLIYTYRHPGP